jgi:hypothetical protein
MHLGCKKIPPYDVFFLHITLIYGSRIALKAIASGILNTKEV